MEPKRPKSSTTASLKRVHPRLPLRVHSAVPKGFAGTGMGNPVRPEPTAGDPVCGSEWSADRLRIRLGNELSSEAWRRLELAARRYGRSVDDFFPCAIEEAS
jgi:hypothetical protein